MDAQMSAANLPRPAEGIPPRGAQAYERALAIAPPRRRVEIGIKIAQAYEEGRAIRRGPKLRALQGASGRSPANAEAAVIIGKDLLEHNQVAGRRHAGLLAR